MSDGESPARGQDGDAPVRGGSTPLGSEAKAPADPTPYDTDPVREPGYKYGSGTRESWSEAEQVEPGPEDDVL